MFATQGDATHSIGIFYDYHYDHDFDYDYHYVRKRQIDNAPELSGSNGYFIVKYEVGNFSNIQGRNQYKSKLDSDGKPLYNLRYDDEYRGHTNYEEFVESDLVELNIPNEAITRIQRAALYDPTILINNWHPYRFKYYPNGFYYYGKSPRTIEISEYLFRCYYGDPNLICLVQNEENHKHDEATFKLDYTDLLI